MTPNSEAIDLLVGFATEQISVEEGEFKHIPSISQSLETIWENPKRKKNTNGWADHTKKAKIAQKEPRKNISKQLAMQNPHTKIPDSEIKIENIIQDSPSFVPYKIKTPKARGKEKGVKDIKLNNDNSDSEIAQMKRTETAEERKDRLKKEKKSRNRANRRADKVAKATKAAKNAAPKTRKTKETGKAPHQQLATKAAHKGGGGSGNSSSGRPKIKKPRINYAIIVMREIHCYQKSVDLLIPLLPFKGWSGKSLRISNRILVSRVLPSWHCKRQQKPGWLASLKVPTFVVFIEDGKQLSQRIFIWYEESTTSPVLIFGGTLSDSQIVARFRMTIHCFDQYI